MTPRRIVSLFASAALTIWLTACGGGGSSTPPTPPAISVALSATPSSLVVGTTTSITATVSNDSANAGVKWTVTCGSAACGSFSASSTASGVATTYTAPGTPIASVTITATSVTDSTKSMSANIAITAPAISVTFNPTPPTSLVEGTAASLTAVVANDTANAGVKWTVTCSVSACGSFAPASTASGAATSYTAPSTAGITVAVTATSVTDTTKFATAMISITVPAIAVTLSAQPPASLVAGTTTSLTAVVANDSANAGVTWTVTCGSAACGGFTPASTASGTATTYTAPSVPPSPATVTITATSVTDKTKTATATISITLGIPGNGTYVYHVSGKDSTGPYFIAGAFTVLNGAITAGEQDFSDHLNAFTNNLVASGSSLSVVGTNIQIVLNTGNSTIGVNGIETFRGAPVSTSRTVISEFDTFGAGTGSIDLQTSTAAPSGGYAFNLIGTDGSTSAFPLVIGGVLDIVPVPNSTTQSISNTGSVFDYNDGGSVGQSQLFSSGSVTAPDSFGRLTFTLTPSSTTFPGIVLNGYIVGTNQIQLVEALGDPLNGNVGGTALGQGSHTGGFTLAGVTGTTYVFTAPGSDGDGDLHIGGGFVFNSNGTVSGVLALNDLVLFGSATITAGNYTVDPTGRVTILGVTPSLVTGTPFAFQLYLDGNGNALTLGVDASELNAGRAYLQTAPAAPFAGTYALFAYGDGVIGSGSSTTYPAWGATGPATVASSAFNGYTDFTILGGTAPTSNVSLTGTETSSSGTLALTGLNAASAQTSNTYTYFPIDATRVIAIETDGSQLSLLQLEGTTP